jgi:hypothetical protein
LDVAGRPIPKEKRKKYMSFWMAVIWEVRRTLKNQIKAMLQTWLGTHFFELLVDIFFWVIDTLTTLDTDLCKIEKSRDPPKIFIPIPRLNRMVALAAIHLSACLFFSERFHSRLNFFKLQTPKNRCFQLEPDLQRLLEFNPPSTRLERVKFMYDNSTPIGGKVSNGIGALIAAINNFPQEWALTPCVGKRNLWPGWQKTKLDRARLIEAIRSQKNHEGKKTAWTGVSVVTGPFLMGLWRSTSTGRQHGKNILSLVAVKHRPLHSTGLPAKSDHFQILLSVPPEEWEGLKPQKIELENGNKLELRWNQCSTLPPSIHPDTGKPYFWESEADTPIAECPDFILDLMRGAPTIELPQKPKPENSISTDASEKSLVDILESEILPRLDAEEFYGNYLKLKTSGKNLVGLCPFHDEKSPSFTISPDTKLFKCFGCSAGGGPVQFIYQLRGGSGSPMGKDFYSVVIELADHVGVKIDDRKFKQNPESKIQHPKPNNVPQPPATNVVRPPQFQVPEISELAGEIEALLNSDLKKSQLQLKISELAQKFRMTSADVWKIYREREEELEQEANKEDVKSESSNYLPLKLPASNFQKSSRNL